jgi:hypothetical protein
MKKEVRDMVLAILIALTSLVAAVIAWQSSVMSDNAAGENSSGLKAALFGEDMRARLSVDAYSTYSTYTDYFVQRRNVELLEQEISDNPEMDAERYARLQRELQESTDQRDLDAQYFESRYLNSDGSYNLNRFIDEKWQAELHSQDMEPLPHFTRADQYQQVASRLLIGLFGLSITLIFYALVGMVADKFKLPLMIAGFLIFLLSTIYSVMQIVGVGGIS